MTTVANPTNRTTMTTYSPGDKVWIDRTRPSILACSSVTADAATLRYRTDTYGNPNSQLWVAVLPTGAETVAHESMMRPR